MGLFDTHCHLAAGELVTDSRSILERARQNSVIKVISIGCSLKEARESIELANQYTEVYATAGLYPHDNGDEEERKLTVSERLSEIEKLATGNRKVIAIGECGLDFTDPPPSEIKRSEYDQEELFRKQIDLARKLDLPVIIHSRQAKEDTLRILEDEINKKPFSAVWHCFTEDAETAGKAVALGVMMSFTGIITYPSAKYLEEIIKNIPPDKFMLETDAPFLVPQTARSAGVKINEPAYVKMVAEKVAQIKGIPLAEVAGQTTINALQFFKV